MRWAKRSEAKGRENKMRKNPQNEEENNNEIKKGFLKKVWYSIEKIEKYSELSAEGFGRAIKYLSILIMLLSIIS